jgi:hypothetical protein
MGALFSFSKSKHKNETKNVEDINNKIFSNYRIS